MDNGMASYDQGVYYPVTSVDGNYGYVYTGTDAVNQWDQHQKLVGLDGQNIHFPGMQTENFPYVYYPSGYDYAQSPYNPYNPYIPGAVIGTDAQFVGTHYMQTVPQPSYGPVMHQPISDTTPPGHSDAYYFNDNVNYTPALSSVSVTTTPLKVSYDNLSLETAHPASQFLTPGWYPEGVGANTASRTKFMPYGDVTSDYATQMMQMTNQPSQGGVLSEVKPVKPTLPLPANYAFTNEGTRQGFQNGRLLNKPTSELNMGPRTSKPKTQLKSPISLKAFTNKAGIINSDGTIVLNPDDYNKDDFPVDYPDAKFFIIKSYSEDDVHKSIKYNVWSSTISGNKKLNNAYEEAQKLSVGKPRKCPVFLFFSVNASGHFCGVAEMTGPVDFNKDMDFWLQDKWSGCFPVKWHIIKDVTNSSFRHIILVNNECRPVTSSRDTQDVPYLPGINMITIFKNTPLKTWILDDFLYYEERQRIMHEEKRMIRQFYEVSISDNRMNAIPDSRSAATIEVSQSPCVVNSNDSNVNTTDSANRKQEISKCTDELNSEPNKPSKSNMQMSTAVDNKVKQPEEKKMPSQKSEEIKIHSQNDADAKSRNGKNNAETKERTTSSQSDTNATKEMKSGKNNLHAKSRNAKKEVKEYKEVKKPTQSNVHVSSSNTTKDSEENADVLTVGSMQINITDTNRLISGSLTIGSFPIDKK